MVDDREPERGEGGAPANESDGGDRAAETGSGSRADEKAESPLRFDDWRRRSATGVVMTGIALGLREALELPDQRPALVIEAPGGPGDPDRPIDLHFDPDDPSATVAVVRRPGKGSPDEQRGPAAEPEGGDQPEPGAGTPRRP